MPNVRPRYDGFSDMPSGLRNFLLADQFTAMDAALQKTYALTPEQTSLLGDKFLDAVFNDATLPETIATLKAALVPVVIPETKWKEFESEFLKTHAWPLRDLFGDELTQILTTDGITSSGWSTQRVILKPLTFSGAASEVANIVGFSLMAPQSRERLRDLLMSKSKGVRLDPQVKESLVRGFDFGGLGLDSATADRTLAVINDIIANAEIMSEDQYADWLSAENRRKVEAMAAQSSTSPEEPEITALKAAMPVAPPSKLDESVEQIFAGIPGKPTDDYLAKRLKYIISSRLRDVRSSVELKQLLLRDSKVGGLGMDRASAESLAAAIEAGYAQFHQPIMDEEKLKLDKQLEEQRVKVEERKKREAEEHAQWYKDKVLARKEEEDQRSKLAEQMKQSFAQSNAPAAEVHPMDLKERKTETARFGEMVPAVAAGAAPVSSTPANTALGVPAPVMQPPMTSAQAARPEVKISTASAALQSAAPVGRPRLDDIAAYGGPKLMGPVRELKNLTLSEFRRMGKTPELSAQKVMQKIDVLSQESFDRRVEGVRAWQVSPLQKDYMSLVQASFAAGKPVTQLAEDKRKAGEDVPSPEELAAIITLNSKLHF